MCVCVNLTTQKVPTSKDQSSNQVKNDVIARRRRQGKRMSVSLMSSSHSRLFSQSVITFHDLQSELCVCEFFVLYAQRCFCF